MKPLRILYDFEAFSDQSRGGITRYVLELAHLVAHEAEVHVAAGVHRSLALRELRPAWAHGRYFPAWPKTGELRRRLNALLTRRAIARFQPDVVHRTYYRHAADYGTSAPQVATLFDLIFFRFPEQFPRVELLQSRLRRVSTQTDRLICISQHTAADAQEILGLPASRTTVIPLGVRSTSPGTGDSPSPKPYLLFVGQRGGYKNFATVLAALALAPELAGTELIAFGGGAWSDGERAALARHALTDRVRLHHGDDRELARHYAHAAALIYPSRYEGFGLPPLEAMHAGCPVICADATSLPEVCGEAAERFDPADPAALVRALRRVLPEAERRAELRAAGLARAAQFSWERCAESTLRLYRELARPR